MKKIYSYMLIFSVAITIVAAGAILLWGLKLGVDFHGGTLFEIQFEKERPQASDIRAAIASAFPDQESSVTLSGENGAIIKMGELTEFEHQKLLTALGSSFKDQKVVELRFDSIGPTIGQELKNKSITAIIIVLLAVIIYIAFVFRALSSVLSPWAMGVAAIAAMLHDIIIPLGLFAYLGKFLEVEISAVFVAAILTILGYSISDTVVVFDRVRENVLRHGRKEGFGDLIHKSVIQTLTRSLNTTLTTVLPLGAIYLFGGPTLQHFSLALIVGICLGSYSSIFVASPILYYWSRWQKGN